MKFDRSKFFSLYRSRYGGVSQPQVNGLEFLLAGFESTWQLWKSVRCAAYGLATVKHETADTFLPIAEYGKGRGHAYGAPDPVTHQAYYGRGDVQLTHKFNYVHADMELKRQLPELVTKFEAEHGKLDLVHKPDQAMDPEIAFAIMTLGMVQGWFTGRKLSHYIDADTTDYFNARRIINGTDRAKLIAGYAKDFEAILRMSAVSTDINTPVFHDRNQEIGQPPTEQPAVIPPPIPNPQTATPSPAMMTTTPTQDNAATDTSSVAQSDQPKEVPAPAKDDSTSTVVKTSIFGIAVPGFVAVVIKAITDAISQGFISAAQIGEFVLNLVKENQKYVILLVVAFVVLLGLKKVLKSITLWFQMYIMGRKDMNDVVIKQG